MLPDYAYFDHSVHVVAGVGCESCHGRIDQMEIVAQDQALSMGWCLDCHPEPRAQSATCRRSDNDGMGCRRLPRFRG